MGRRLEKRHSSLWMRGLVDRRCCCCCSRRAQFRLMEAFSLAVAGQGAIAWASKRALGGEGA